MHIFLLLLSYFCNHLEMPSKELRNLGLFKKDKNGKSIV